MNLRPSDSQDSNKTEVASRRRNCFLPLVVPAASLSVPGGFRRVQPTVVGLSQLRAAKSKSLISGRSLQIVEKKKPGGASTPGQTLSHQDASEGQQPNKQPGYFFYGNSGEEGEREKMSGPSRSRDKAFVTGHSPPKQSQVVCLQQLQSQEQLQSQQQFQHQLQMQEDLQSQQLLFQQQVQLQSQQHMRNQQQLQPQQQQMMSQQHTITFHHPNQLQSLQRLPWPLDSRQKQSREVGSAAPHQPVNPRSQLVSPVSPSSTLSGAQWKSQGPPEDRHHGERTIPDARDVLRQSSSTRHDQRRHPRRHQQQDQDQHGVSHSRRRQYERRSYCSECGQVFSQGGLKRHFKMVHGPRRTDNSTIQRYRAVRLCK